MKKLVTVFIAVCLILMLSSQYVTATHKPKPTKGEKLYNSKCKSCHGKGAVGKFGPNIVGATAEEISAAIASVTKMKKLKKLKSETIAEIAEYLATL